jgi:hypothetical protein
MKTKVVYIMTTKAIGFILDSGKDSAGVWYRTDADGVRDPDELLWLYSKKDVKRCKKQMNATIAPSTSVLIDEYFNNK